MPDSKLESIPEWERRSMWILDSYRKWVGCELIDRSGSRREQARRLFEAPLAVLAHGTESDPILMYANRRTIELWELPLEVLLETPSRKTAEPDHRHERAHLLERVSRDGFIDDYRGIRISGTGRRFWITQATVWNLLDEWGAPAGQAAAFSEIQRLPETPAAPFAS